MNENKLRRNETIEGKITKALIVIVKRLVFDISEMD